MLSKATAGSTGDDVDGEPLTAAAVAWWMEVGAVRHWRRPNPATSTSAASQRLVGVAPIFPRLGIKPPLQTCPLPKYRLLLPSSPSPTHEALRALHPSPPPPAPPPKIPHSTPTSPALHRGPSLQPTPGRFGRNRPGQTVRLLTCRPDLPSSLPLGGSTRACSVES